MHAICIPKPGVGNVCCFLFGICHVFFPFFKGPSPHLFLRRSLRSSFRHGPRASVSPLAAVRPFHIAGPSLEFGAGGVGGGPDTGTFFLVHVPVSTCRGICKSNRSCTYTHVHVAMLMYMYVR